MGTTVVEADNFYSLTQKLDENVHRIGTRNIVSIVITPIDLASKWTATITHT